MLGKMMEGKWRFSSLRYWNLRYFSEVSTSCLGGRLIVFLGGRSTLKSCLHWEGKRDDGDIEDGAEDVAGAWGWEASA